MSSRKRLRQSLSRHFPELLVLESRILFSNTTVATSTLLTVSTNAVQVGNAVTFTATVTPQTGGPLNGQEVDLVEDGSILVAIAPLVNGTATITWAPRGGGLQSISAEFAGQDEFAASASNEVDVNVFRLAAQLNLQATAQGGLVHVAATATSLDPSPFSPTGAVEIFNGTAFVGTIQLGTGQGLNLHLPARTYDLRAAYGGDGAFFPAQTVQQVVVPPLPTSGGNAPALTSVETVAGNVTLPSLVLSSGGSLSSSAGDGPAFHLNFSTLPPEAKQFYEFHLPPALDPNGASVNSADAGAATGAFSEKDSGASAAASPTSMPPTNALSKKKLPAPAAPTAFSQAQ